MQLSTYFEDVGAIVRVRGVYMGGLGCRFGQNWRNVSSCLDSTRRVSDLSGKPNELRRVIVSPTSMAYAIERFWRVYMGAQGYRFSENYMNNCEKVSSSEPNLPVVNFRGKPD